MSALTFTALMIVSVVLYLVASSAIEKWEARWRSCDSIQREELAFEKQSKLDRDERRNENEQLRLRILEHHLVPALMDLASMIDGSPRTAPTECELGKCGAKRRPGTN